ncbi:hypothetical protein [Streptomyces sp. CBMA156]|uniref:hypothetical protein n=1 Tax=Streptomyces sp. CBMA156 TaxID=1930280 RepID=UPI0016621228|nr:hypothetical protein [Streptomyces sp. CBMA156]MBD0675158.1 hypothetical protein [Streptomyces sp. CBMA156]
MNPQDLRDASTAGYAVAKDISQDWAQAFGQVPPVLGLANWMFEGPAKAAVHDLGRHIGRITTNRLEEAAGNLSIMARTYEGADAGAASTVGGAGTRSGAGEQG